MKKILIIATSLLITCFCSSAFALSDAEYRSMMKNSAFANADKALNAAWAEAKGILYGSDFDNLKKNQQQWIKSGRDAEAKYFMNNNGLSKVEAYTAATNARANYIRNRTRELSSTYDILAYSMEQTARQISKSSKPTAQASNVKAWNDKNNLVVFEYSAKSSFLVRFWTSDPKFDFTGIRVGSSVRELENFLGLSSKLCKKFLLRYEREAIHKFHVEVIQGFFPVS